MKKIILCTIAIFISFLGYGQNEDLYQDWYLYSYSYDLGDTFLVQDITPSIAPFLTIDENLEFTGQACNEYLGNFSYEPNNDLLVLDFFDLCLCDSCNDPPQSHIDFENDYFSYFFVGDEYYYDIYNVIISENEEYNVLILYAYPGFELVYYNVPVLSTSNFVINNIKIYPNPVSEILFISSEENTIETFIIYSITGEVILEDNNTTNSMDVSSLSKGMYFVEMISSEGKTTKKFIKK